MKLLGRERTPIKLDKSLEVLEENSEESGAELSIISRVQGHTLVLNSLAAQIDVKSQGET